MILEKYVKQAVMLVCPYNLPDQTYSDVYTSLQSNVVTSYLHLFKRLFAEKMI